MSTFTDCNGPFSSSFTDSNGPSTPDCGTQSGSVKSLIDLINAYEALYHTVQQHITATAAIDNIHSVQNYVQSVLSDKQDKLTILDIIDNSTNPVQSSAIKTALDAKQNNLTFDTAPIAGSTNPVTSAGIYTAINNLANTLNTALDTKQNVLTFDNVPTAGSSNSVTSGSIFDAINVVKDLLTQFTDNFIVTNNIVAAKKVLSSTQYLLGKIHASELIDFTDWVTFSAQPAGLNTSDGTDTSGAYILGQLSVNWGNEPGDVPIDPHKSKACRAYIKYVNTHSLDAIIDMVVSYDSEAGYTGSLSVQVAHNDGDWEDLAFHLMEGTDIKGNKVIYLCISSSSIAYSPSEYSTFNFRACGINFIPPTAEGYVLPVGSGEYLGIPITSTVVGNVSSAFAVKTAVVNELYLTKLYTARGNELFEIDANDHIIFGETPYVKDDDGNPLPIVSEVTLNTIVPIGAILRWPNMDNIPARFHATNGDKVLAETYTALATIITPGADGYITLPVEDNSIIRLY